MSDTPQTTTWFIPLSQRSIDALLQIPAALSSEAFAAYSIAELAAIRVILDAPKLDLDRHGASTVERMLAKLIEVGHGLERETGGSFAGVVAHRFTPASFQHGLRLLGQAGTCLLDSEDLEQHDYLTSEGTCDFEFRQRHQQQISLFSDVWETSTSHRYPVTSDQARIIRILECEPDESLHLQALTGTGKTHLIELLLDQLTLKRPLLLTMTPAQLGALSARLGGALRHGITFGKLAKQLLENDRTQHQRRAGHRDRPSFQVSDLNAARMLRLCSIGNLIPARVAQLCRRAVSSFCYSNAAELNATHLPSLNPPLTEVDRAILVHYAELYWQQTIEPSDLSISLLLRSYHRIKHLSLLPELKLSNYYTHIIVDESHDLSAPMLQFLDRCHQPTYTLGDICQSLDGITNQRANFIRQRNISQSVRAGRQIEAVINPLIQAHPHAPVEPLQGSQARATRIHYYDHPSIPDSPCTILVKSEWSLFEWFQRLGNAQARFSLLTGTTEANLRSFVLSCVELFRFGTAPIHSMLFRYSTWDALANAYAGHRTFRNIEAMLQRGYSSSDFERSLMLLDRSGKSSIRLGRIDDARNMELDSVMLAPDLLTPVKSGNIDSAARTFTGLYTGSSRAKFELIVPGYLHDWLSDQVEATRS
uniref:Putative DNA helicase n=1 Tax=symbiont bacterium of Paederus fuscipes TaxID=176282 RepID=Q6VT91_UNCXX|nr:putative DNA helicase [symbiont bacterium of Paederus fuscipes]